MGSNFLKAIILGAILFLLYYLKIISGGWLLIGIVIYLLWISVTSENEQKDKLRKALDSISDDYDFTKYYGDKEQLIALDNKKKVIALKESQSSEISIYKYKDILKYEILKNNELISKKQGTVGRAVVGGLLLGPLGALVGGMSAGSKTEDKVKSIDLRIYVNDMDNPTHTINFYNSLKEPSLLIEHKVKELAQWQGMIEIILN